MNKVLKSLSANKKIWKLINEVQAVWNIPGIAYGLIINNEISELGGVGYIASNGKKVNENTLFRIGSNSKAFTCSLLIELMKQRKLDINECVIKYLPDFKIANDELSQKVCVKDLVTHYTGIGKFTSSMMAYLGYSKDDMMSSFRHAPVIKEFRSSFQYHDGLYVVAGEIIDKITGKPYVENFETLFFRPLDFKNTFMSLEQVNLDNLAKPHVSFEQDNIEISQSPFSDAIGPGGKINTTANDLVNWLLFNIRLFEGKNIKDCNYQLQFKPYVTLSGNFDKKLALDNLIQQKAYALGWYISKMGNYTLYEHLGGVPGYTSYLSFFPEIAAGIVLLCNKVNMRYPLELLRLNFFELLINDNYTDLLNNLKNETDNMTTSLERLIDRHQAMPINSNLKNLKVICFNPMYQYMEFSVNDDIANICFNASEVKIIAKYIGDNKFAVINNKENFGCSLKLVTFQVKISDRSIILEIYMDNQRGGLSWIGTHKFSYVN